MEYPSILKSLDSSESLVNSSKFGHWLLVRYLKPKYPEVCSEALLEAIQNGHLEIIRYLSDSPPHNDYLTQAIALDNPEIVKLFVRTDQDRYTSLLHACCFGYPEIVRCLLIKRDFLDEVVINSALFSGNREIVEYLIERGSSFNHLSLACTISGYSQMSEQLKDLSLEERLDILRSSLEMIDWVASKLNISTEMVATYLVYPQSKEFLIYLDNKGQ